MALVLVLVVFWCSRDRIQTRDVIQSSYSSQALDLSKVLSLLGKTGISVEDIARIPAVLSAVKRE